MLKVQKENILEILRSVPDPEIPALNIVEMGIVREINFLEKSIEILITPTYSGCPAMKTIEEEITDILFDSGFKDVAVKQIYSPAWTTDWLSEETRAKLKDYGIAPPEGMADDEFYRDLAANPVECPFCGSRDTSLTSGFGSTACKSLHFCNECEQPFEHFKCI